FLPCNLGEPGQSIEIDLDVGDASVGEDYPAVGGTRLHADFRQAFGSGRAPSECLVEPVHVGLELFDGRILGADFTDLAADRNVDSLRLQASHGQCELDRLLEIDSLLLLESRLGKIDERRGIDVDVVETGRDRFARELLYTVYFRHGVDGEFLGIHLKVVALNEYRPAKPFAQRGGQHHRHI